MEFLRAYEEAQRLGISFDDFRSIWERENEVKLELQRAQTVQAMNPEPNVSTSDQSRDLGESNLSGLLSNILAEISKFQTNLENQAKFNEKLMGEINDLRNHKCEQSREYKDQILNNAPVRVTLRPNHGPVAVQPARNLESHRAKDIGSILATPFSAILNSTPDVILTPLEVSSYPSDVPAFRLPTVGSLFRDEMPADNIQNTKVDAPTQELPGVVKTRAPYRATMRRLSRHSSLVPTFSVNLAGKEKVGDGLEVLAEENSLSEVKDLSKKDVKVDEDYIEKDVNVASAAQELKSEEREVKAEKRAPVKKAVQAEEKPQIKKFNVALAAQGKKGVNIKERDHGKMEVKAKEFVKPGGQANAGSKGKLFNAEKRNNPHMLDKVGGRLVLEGAEKHTMMQNPLDSSKLSEVRDDMDKNVFLKNKYIDNSGRIIIDSLYPQCPLESDYFYTRGRKKCQVKLRYSFKENNVLSVKLCVSHVPGVNEYIWPIFIDASGKVYNRKTDKPSPLWTLKRNCFKPDRGEEREMEANISLVTKSKSFQKVTFEMLQKLEFEIGNCFKLFWEVTTS